MKITTDIKDELLTLTSLIENIEVVYKKKDKYNGEVTAVKYKPFEVIITDRQRKEDQKHTIDFDSAEQITIKYFDGTVKTYQDEIA
jgi:hypothetical protein